MAIVSLGIDLVEIARLEQVIERRGARFLERVFTAGERAYCDGRASRIASYAGRFAVKEAAMKVLGTGWSRGVRWLDLEVVRERGQAPRLVMHGVSAEIARKKGIARVHVAITHDAGIASAVAVAED